MFFTLLYIFASIGFFLFSLKIILSWTTIWQQNEYKIGRMLFSLRQRSNKLQYIILQSIFFLFIVLYVIIIFQDVFSTAYEILMALLFCLLGFAAFNRFRYKTFTKPKPTFKALSISLLSLFIISLLFTIPLVDPFLWLVFLAFILPFVVAGFVALFSFPTEIYTDIYLQRAKRKIDLLENAKIILISGNSEKYSTRQHMVHLLSKYFKVTTNKPGQESPLSLAKVIHKYTQENTNLLIFTIAAEDKEAIEKIVSILRPHILVMVGIPRVYEDLPKEKNKFISLHSKLIHAHSQHSIALFNGESEELVGIAKRIKKSVVLYGTEDDFYHKQFQVLGYNVRTRKMGTSFEVKLKRQKYFYKTKLHGKKVVSTLLPAIYIAHILNISASDIEKTIKQMGRSMRYLF